MFPKKVFLERDLTLRCKQMFHQLRRSVLLTAILHLDLIPAIPSSGTFPNSQLTQFIQCIFLQNFDLFWYPFFLYFRLGKIKHFSPSQPFCLNRIIFSKDTKRPTPPSSKFNLIAKKIDKM